MQQPTSMKFAIASILLCGQTALASASEKAGTTSNAEPTQLVEETEIAPVKEVIGGAPLPNRAIDAPWLAAIGAQFLDESIILRTSPFRDVYCGATIISERALLSAAHCFACPPYNKSDPEEVEFFDNCTFGEFFAYPGDQVILNRTNVTENEGIIVYEICNEEGGKGCKTRDTDAYVINHPKFTEPEFPPDQYGNDFTVEYDMAVIVLPKGRPAPPELTPIALNSDPMLPEDSATLHVTGWGNLDPFIDGEDFPDVPYIVDVDYVSSERCMTSPFEYPEGSITETIMCAAKEDKDACNGDSGGPLVKITPEGPLEVGIVSFGWIDDKFRCSSPIFPGAYARVSAGFCWITETACHETENTGKLCEASRSNSRCASGSKSGKKNKTGSKGGKKGSKEEIRAR